TLYGYLIPSDGSAKTITNNTGATGGGFTSVTNGTETITVTDGAGNVLTNSVYDIASGLLVEQEITVTNDALGRPLEVITLGGTNSSSYGCCGITSTTNTEGVATTYTYDALNRTITTTRAGITTSNAYDVANQLIATFRNGVMMTSNAYDVAGRLVSTTDALTNTTTYAWTTDDSGHTVKTTTYPDSSTRIETYYQDGQLKSLTGSAVHGVRYEYGVTNVVASFITNYVLYA